LEVVTAVVNVEDFRRFKQQPTTNNSNNTNACLLMFGLEKPQEAKDAILLV